jgi:hypothetical protein
MRYSTPPHHLYATVHGKLFRDPVGRLYFDTCKDGAEHMAKPVPDDQERRTCRTYLDDLLAPMIGDESPTGAFKMLMSPAGDLMPDEDSSSRRDS